MRVGKWSWILEAVGRHAGQVLPHVGEPSIQLAQFFGLRGTPAEAGTPTLLT